MPFTPYDAATDMLKRARSLERRAGRFKNQSSPLAKDLLRLAVVMSVAALDTYMHRLVVERAFSKPTLPTRLAGVTVTFGDLLTQAQNYIEAHREGRNTRPRVAAKRILRNRLLRETFQGFDQLAGAFAMLGIESPWKRIGDALSPKLTPKDIKKRLNGVVERRNWIAHEGDYVRSDRPQQAKLNPILAADVADDILFVESLISAIHSIA